MLLFWAPLMLAASSCCVEANFNSGYADKEERDPGITYETDFEDVWLELFVCWDARVVIPHFAADGPTVHWHRRTMSSAVYRPVPTTDEKVIGKHGFWVNGTDLILEHAQFTDTGLYRATKNSRPVRLIIIFIKCIIMCNESEQPLNCAFHCMELGDVIGQNHVEAVMRDRAKQELAGNQPCRTEYIGTYSNAITA